MPWGPYTSGGTTAADFNYYLTSNTTSDSACTYEWPLPDQWSDDSWRWQRPGVVYVAEPAQSAMGMETLHPSEPNEVVRVTVFDANHAWEEWCREVATLFAQTPVHSATTGVREGTLINEAANPVTHPLAEREANLRKERDDAKTRADVLLRSVLDEEQLEEYEEHGSFIVKINTERSLRIHRGRVRNVDELDADGNKVAELCIHVSEAVPNEDNMLAQLLFAKADPEGFFSMANRYNYNA